MFQVQTLFLLISMAVHIDSFMFLLILTRYEGSAI